MKTSRFTLVLGLLCVAAFVAFWLWQTPGALGSRLTPADVERYVARLEQLPVPAEEKVGAIARMRTWAEADDGRPVLMLNLMRYHEDLRRWPGAPAFDGTPQQSNDYYESQVIPIALGLGAYPLAGGEAQGRDVLVLGGPTRGLDVHAAEAQLDDWSRVLLMRYPNRRAFLDLVTDPRYLPNLPYKLMALQVVLVPTTADVVIPEWRWLSGGLLLILFLAVGWWRAARR